MLMQTKTIAAGLPGLRKTLRGLAGMASALALVGVISVGMETSAQAAVITSQVGTPEATGSTTLGNTLTSGFTSSGCFHPRNPGGNIRLGDKCRQSVGKFDNFGSAPSCVQYKRLNSRNLMELARHLQGDERQFQH